MKKFLLLNMMVAVSVVALAQSFSIRRPSNGAVVRETVKVLFAKQSIPQTGYIGITVNGKFMEAVSPGPEGGSSVEGDNFIYELDTKALKIPDGNLNIEAVLYADFGDTVRAIGRSSVRVRVDNYSSIKTPQGGFKLRYKYNPGTERTYKVTVWQSSSTISEAQAKLGARALELPEEGFSFRYRYNTDNAYAVGGRREGLIRMQVVPDKGKDYAVVPLAGEDVAKKHFEKEFYPIYMRLQDTGREIFGRSPIYIPMEGSGSQNEKFYIWGNFPLPILPDYGVKQGQEFEGSIVGGLLKSIDPFTTERLTLPQRATGRIESIEWQDGIRTVKVVTSQKTSEALAKLTADESQSEIRETYWFALDGGYIIRMEQSYMTTQKIKAQTVAANTGGGAGGGGNGAPRAPSAAGSAGGGSSNSSDFNGPATGSNIQDDSGGFGRPGGTKGGGPKGGGNFGGGNQGGGGRPGGGGGSRGAKILTTKVSFVMTLEK